MIVEERAEGYGGQLREMRGEADGVVVLLGAEPQGVGADFFQDFYEGGDARIALVGRSADEGVRVVAEEVGVGVGNAGLFPASHGVAAEEEICGVIGEMVCGVFRDAHFGAAGVGDERMPGGEACDFWEEIESGADGQCDVNEIGIFQGRTESAGKGGIYGPARLRFADDFGAVPARDVDVGRVFAQSEGERAAD